MNLSVPRTKTARRAAIAQIIAARPVSSQAELREILAERGINTTQATLSRDLLEMRATKVRDATGNPVYLIPGTATAEQWKLVGRAGDNSDALLSRWCQDLLVAADVSGNLLLLRTPTGAAQLLGTAVDAAVLDEIMGTVAGNDTVLVICRSDPAADRLRQYFLCLADPSLAATDKPRERPTSREFDF